MIYCPQCEKTTEEDIKTKDIKAYRITTTLCGECRNVLICIKRLIRKKSKK